MIARGAAEEPARGGWREGAVVVVLIGLFAVQALLSMRGKSATADEPIYLAAGDRILRTGDLETNEISSPFLLKPLLALPLQFLDHPRPDGNEVLHDGKLIDQWRWARRFLYGPQGDAPRVLWLVRCVSVLLGVLLALSTYALARRLIGRRGALATLLLFSFSPHLLAHTRLATLDIGLTLLTVECLRQWALYLEGGGWRRVLAVGVLLGLALLAKTATAALVAYLGAVHLWLTIHRRCSRAPRRTGPAPLAALAVIGLVALLVVNGAFGFRGSLRPLASLERGGASLQAALAKLDGGAGGWVARHLPIPLPGSYQRLMLEQAGRARSPKQVTFHGARRAGGWWWFMPIAWGLKTPLAVVLMVLAGWLFLARRSVEARRLEPGDDAARAKPRRSAVLLCVAGFGPFLFVFYSAVSQFGLVRYLLPAEPLLLIAAGLIPARLWNGGRPLRRLVAALLIVLSLAPSLLCHPDYLAFTNVLTGGPAHAWRWFSDSNLDWGQDLDGLGRYVEEHGIERIALAYFGSADPDALGLSYRRLPSVGIPPAPGEPWWWEKEAMVLPDDLSGPVAISATCLAGTLFPDPDLYARFRDREPVDQIGHSILIFQAGDE